MQLTVDYVLPQQAGGRVLDRENDPLPKYAISEAPIQSHSSRSAPFFRNQRRRRISIAIPAIPISEAETGSGIVTGVT
jgi:hypothetical protein